MTFHDPFQDFFVFPMTQDREVFFFQSSVKTIIHSRYFLLCCSKKNQFQSFSMTLHEPLSNLMDTLDVGYTRLNLVKYKV